MPGPGLPVTIDSAYADDGSDATVKLHQQHHDVLHAFANEFDTATRQDGQVWLRSGGLWVPSLLSTKAIPTTDIEDTPGGNYTFTAADAGKYKASKTSDTAAVTWTIPTNASVPMPIGTTIGIAQWGTGQITIVGAAGVVLRAPGGATSIALIYGGGRLIKRFTDTWWLEARAS